MLLSLFFPMALTFLHGSRNTAMALGGLAGALSGLVLARRQRLYPEGEPAPRRRERLLLGLVGLPALYLALLLLTPEETSRIFFVYLWMRFATIGLWVSYLVPRIVAYVRARHEDLDAPPAR